MPFYTNIAVKRSSKKTYFVDDNIILIPAKREILELDRATISLNSMWFYTNSITLREHLFLLERWVVFHSFILKENTIYYYNKGKYKDHFSIDDFRNIQTNGVNDPQYEVDYDDIGYYMYFYDKPFITISYKDLYSKTPDNYFDYFITYLDRLTDMPTPRPYPTLNNEVIRSGEFFMVKPLYDRSYLQITTLVTLLETIIGHAPTCEVRYSCKKCKKVDILHRGVSEKDWRNSFLKAAITKDSIREEYSKIINFAFNLRHKTVHAGSIPTAQRIMLEAGTEIFDTNRSIGQHKEDTTALFSILWLIQDVTRNLFLYKYYDLKIFFPLKPLNQFTFTC